MNYSIGFYTGGGNIEDWSKLTKEDKKTKLQKDWYVWWSYRNPETHLLERQEPNIKSGINGYKSKSARLKAMQEIKRLLIDLLKTGYSPYDLPNSEPKLISIEFALDEALKSKKVELKQTTYEDYKSRIKQLKEYLSNKGFKNIKEVNKECFSRYLNTIKGNKNSNNTKAVLSSIFSKISSIGYIESNFIKEIKNKRITEKPVKIYSEENIKNIVDLLQEHDYNLLMFIYFVCYMFWRPIEIVRIKISDIDFDKKIIRTETKTKTSKTKIIPDILLEDLKAFVKGKTGYLFKPDDIDKWDIDEIAKRNYFTRRFARFRKKYGIDKEFKLYSFRHTYITKIYLELRKAHSKEETIKILSLITGHESKAIYNYIRVNDVELPEDYSDYLK